MKLVKYQPPQGNAGIGLLQQDHVLAFPPQHTLSELLEAARPAAAAEALAEQSPQRWPLNEVTLLAPIDQQEVWAAGVTYRRSKVARMEESETSASCYDRVYRAARPELFFKANPHRVVGPEQPVRVRGDSRWSVPEPELALVLSSRLQLVGFTIGNDMSARDIEGENPLYLPQAKVYDASAALGPCITLAEFMPPPAEISVQMTIHRDGRPAFAGQTSVGNLVRTYDELIGWLGRDNGFPHGAILMTGTGIVPEGDFTLRQGDVIEIHIDGIGTLRNPVVQRCTADSR